jgi:subtilisin family serine protease
MHQSARLRPSFRSASSFRSARSALLALLLVACGGDSTAPPSPTTVVLSAPNPVLTSLGETVQLSAQVLDGRGNPMTGQAINWTSGSSSVVQVSGSGLATATGVGSATITASAGSASGTLSLTVEQRPSELLVTGGVAQEGEVGSPLPQPVSFRVADARGNPAPNAVVSVTVQGGGSVSAPQVTTGPDGVGQVVWTLGTRVLDAQALVVTAGAISRAVTATARPGAPSDLVPSAGTGQTGLAGEALPDSLEVMVQDRFANPVPGAAVSWSVEAGGGSVGPAQGVSSASGTVRARWVLGNLVGVNRARAVLSGAQAEFQANGLPNGVIAGTISLTGAFLAPSAVSPFGGASTLQAMAQDWSGQGSGKGGQGAVGPSGLQVVWGTGAARFRSASPARVDTVPGQWVVKMRSPAPTRGLAVGGFSLAAARAEGGVLRERLSALQPVASGGVEVSNVAPVLGIARVEVAPGAAGEAALQRLRTAPEVEWVEPVILYHTFEEEATATLLNPAADLLEERFYPQQSWHYGLIGLPRAWELTRGSAQVVVAVVDDGIRFDHPSIAANLTNDGYDFVSDIALPSCTGGTVPSPGDGDGWDPDPTIPLRYNLTGNCISGTAPIGGHGLHVAGTIAASSELVGVAPGVRIRPVRALGSAGSGSNIDIAFAILYSAGFPVEVAPGQFVQVPRAPIINLSLGGPGNSAALEDAVIAASAAGSLLVASAGNDGNIAPNYPASYPQTLSVSAIGPDYALASYSNRGSTIDIAAPGGDGASGGRGSVWSTYWRFSDDRPLLHPLDGTSMAAPHVSGVAALLLSQTPGLSANQLRDILLGTALDLGSPGRDDFYGHGMVQALAALTGGQGLPGALSVHLTEEVTGQRVASVAAGSGQSFRFAGLPDGRYQVHAGLDDRGNGITGRPGFLWGAFGGAGSPTSIAIVGHGVRDGSFTIGFPIEKEPNGSNATADDLEVGGYSYGILSPAGDRDIYRVRVPAAGLYTFETHGIFGFCGWGLEVDTIMDVYASGGQLLITQDDFDADRDRFCSRVSLQLQPGVYFVHVRGFGSATGQYGVSVRAGG